MSDFVIRGAVADDAALILRFVKELAEYERASDEVLADEQSIRETVFSDKATVQAVICERDGRAIGFAVFFFNYSTWLGRNGLYLEDLYITPEHRGSGAGKALLQHLARIAVANDCGRFEWSVLNWNTPAIEFYRSLGATPQDEWTVYRLTGEALQALAVAPPTGQ